MKMKTISAMAMLLTAGVLFLCGCRSSEYYREQAVERAREYLLENVSDFSAEEIAFIRYNQPALLTGSIIGTPGSLLSGNVSVAVQQICVTWLLPKRKDAYMVFGVSDGHMREWYPEQLIVKTFYKGDPARAAAISAARAYALNNMYYDMNSAQYNRVRFAEPEVVRTNFILPLNPDGKLTPEEEAELQKKPQYSLVWTVPGRDNMRMIISGQSDKSLAGWSVLAAGEYPAEELLRHTVAEAESPADKNTAESVRKQ